MPVVAHCRWEDIGFAQAFPIASGKLAQGGGAELRAAA
jgi:hypothetical protein